MATKKTILFIKVNAKEYEIKYSGGLGSLGCNRSTAERREALRHDRRLADAFLSMPDDVYERFFGIFRAIDRCKRREAKRKAKEQAQQEADK